MAIPAYSPPIGPAEFGTTIATIFTVPPSYPMKLTSVWIANRTAGDLTFTLHVVPAGTTAADSNKIFGAVPIVANDVRQYDLKIPMLPGYTLQGLASGAGVNYAMEAEFYRST